MTMLVLTISTCVLGAPSPAACSPVCGGPVYSTPCVSNAVFLPCQSVSYVVETSPTQLVAESVAADPKPVPEAEAESVLAEAAAKDEESVLEPAGLVFPRLALEHMGLDWGLANIAAGTLYPNSNTMGMGGIPMFPGGGGGGSDSNGSSSSVLPPPIVIINYPPGGTVTPPVLPPPPGGGGGSTVPEPASLATWLVVSVIGHRLRRRQPAVANAVDDATSL